MTRLKTITTRDRKSIHRLWESFYRTFQSVSGAPAFLNAWPKKDYDELLKMLLEVETHDGSTIKPGSLEMTEKRTQWDRWRTYSLTTYSSRRRLDVVFASHQRTPIGSEESEWSDWSPVEARIDFGEFGSTTAAWTLLGDYFDRHKLHEEHKDGEFEDVLKDYEPKLSFTYWNPPNTIEVRGQDYYVVGIYDHRYAEYHLRTNSDHLRDLEGWSDQWRPFAPSIYHPLGAELDLAVRSYPTDEIVIRGKVTLQSVRDKVSRSSKVIAGMREEDDFTWVWAAEGIVGIGCYRPHPDELDRLDLIESTGTDQMYDSWATKYRVSGQEPLKIQRYVVSGKTFDGETEDADLLVYSDGTVEEILDDGTDFDDEAITEVRS